MPTPALTPTPVFVKSLPVPIITARAAAPKPSASEADLAYDLVGGKWTCRSFAGTPISHRFRRDEDAVSLIVDTTLLIKGQPVRFTERYRYHPSSRRWTVSLINGLFVATAAQWTGPVWKYSGIDSEGGRATLATMVYKRSDLNAFVRSFTRTELDGSLTRSGEQCLRVSQ